MYAVAQAKVVHPSVLWIGLRNRGAHQVPHIVLIDSKREVQRRVGWLGGLGRLQERHERALEDRHALNSVLGPHYAQQGRQELHHQRTPPSLT